ncbi:hypothetical protein POX_b02598 [Penicillium oxalicum]|uniref:hypothetical protein n=1 Tax=Penicillium oxalicum TaxID=69781 RepID=UPI0020B73D6A|nr:hypothetical protein POX_b02598 [Penicillium oxalicum]KAI2792560.1 hypothetical protein POX_b02598 [Penicillium oxalicum]
MEQSWSDYLEEQVGPTGIEVSAKWLGHSEFLSNWTSEDNKKKKKKRKQDYKNGRVPKELGMSACEILKVLGRRGRNPPNRTSLEIRLIDNGGPDQLIARKEDPSVTNREEEPARKGAVGQLFESRPRAWKKAWHLHICASQRPIANQDLWMSIAPQAPRGFGFTGKGISVLEWEASLRATQDSRRK